MTISEIERTAAKSDPMPDGLTLPQQWLYLSLRSLYREFRSGTVSKEQARQEKLRLINEYEVANLHYQAYTQSTERRNRYSSVLVEAEKNGCEICKRIVRIFDGRE